jgi:hypothetical protein
MAAARSGQQHAAPERLPCLERPVRICRILQREGLADLRLERALLEHREHPIDHRLPVLGIIEQRRARHEQRSLGRKHAKIDAIDHAACIAEADDKTPLGRTVE